MFGAFFRDCAECNETQLFLAKKPPMIWKNTFLAFLFSAITLAIGVMAFLAQQKDDDLTEKVGTVLFFSFFGGITAAWYTSKQFSRLFRRLRGTPVYCFLSRRELPQGVICELHQHLEDPTLDLNLLSFLPKGFRDWSHFLNQNFILKIFVHAKRQSVFWPQGQTSYGCWKISQNWDGASIRFRDVRGNEISAWRVEGSVKGMSLADVIKYLQENVPGVPWKHTDTLDTGVVAAASKPN